MSKPEEKVDDPQQKETQTKSEEAKKEEVKLPESKFFTGDKMKNWAEQMGLLDEEPVKKPVEKEPEKKEEQKPEEKPPSKKDEKPGEEEKPFKVLTYKGKEVKIMTEEDYNKLASEGLDYTQKSQTVAERERTITEREDSFKRLSAPLETVAKAIEEGKLSPVKTEEQQTEETALEKIVNNEEIDPELRAAFKTQNNELKALRAEMNDSKKVEQTRVEQQREASLGQAKVELESMVVKSKEDHPFDEIKEGEVNITESVFTGLVISKANADRIKASKDPTFKRRNMQDLVTETALDLSKIQKHYEAKHSISSEKEPVTSAKLRELYPDQIKEIEQDRVASYHEEQESGAPIAKSVKEGETTSPVEKKKEKQFTGVKDAIDQAFKDPEMAKALKEEGDETLREIRK